jgi:hypothetical protein
MELFAMAAAVSRARRMADERDPEAVHAAELADLFCRLSRRKVRRLFGELWSNEDARLNRMAARVLAGEEAWLEKGILDIGLTPEAFKTRSILSQRERVRESA